MASLSPHSAHANMLVHDGLGLKYVFVQSQPLIVARNLVLEEI